jgi:putative membrane protein
MIPTLAETVVVHHGHWFPWFPLVPLAFVAAWFVLFWLVFRRRWRGFPGPSAEAVLAERFARGEIEESEFRERRSVLRRND